MSKIREQIPKNIESINGQSIEVFDLSQRVQEETSLSQPKLNVINTTDLLEANEVAIGIGKPNVFTLFLDEQGREVKVDSKSLWRKPTKITRTGKKVQSGIFFLLELDDVQKAKLEASAHLHEGTKNITCVNSNTRIWHDAGFRLGDGSELEHFLFPIDFFKAVTKHGLMTVEGEKIEIHTVKTTNKQIENQAFETKLAVVFTLCRHIDRALNRKNTPLPKKGATENTDEAIPKAPYMDPLPDEERDIELFAFNTSKTGSLMRLVWGPHAIFKIAQDRVDIDDYLTEPMPAFPQENPSFFTKIKRDYLFNNGMVKRINKHLQKEITSFDKRAESDLFNFLKTDSAQSNNKYNIVASDSGVMLSRVKNSLENPKFRHKMADWILSKHVLVSNYDKDVRFAGELWKDEDGVIWINNNSGTYQPNIEKLEAFQRYLHTIFPHYDIKIKAEK